jgi:hypothetical protein
MPQIMLGTLPLPPDLHWSDEFNWLPVGASSKTSVAGSKIVQTGRLLAARPITLEGGDDFAWISYAEVEALRDMAGEPDTFRNLVLPDGRTFTVRFRLEEVAVEAEPVLHRGTPSLTKRDALQFIPTIRLETV